MKRASITEAKNNLSALIDGVKGGSASPAGEKDVVTYPEVERAHPKNR